MDYCEECGRVGDDIGDCGRKSMPCPTPLPIEDNKAALISCGPCGKLLAFPVADLIKGKLRGGSNTCVLDVCAATLVLPVVEAPQQKTKTVTKEVTVEVIPDDYKEAFDRVPVLEAELKAAQDMLDGYRSVPEGAILPGDPPTEDPAQAPQE